MGSKRLMIIMEKFVIPSNSPSNATSITNRTNIVFMYIINLSCYIEGILYKRTRKQKDKANTSIAHSLISLTSFFRSDTLAINSFITFCCCNIDTINNDSGEKYSSLELAALTSC
jgi:hypothetical protein